jgi:rieske iron-sulfur protein
MPGWRCWTLTNDSRGRATIDRRISETADTDPRAPDETMRAAACPCAIATAGRRALLAAGVGLGVGLVAGTAGAQTDPTRDRPKEGDLLIKAGDTAPVPLTPDSIPLGAGQILAWPMDPAGNVVRDGSRLNKVLLVRLDPAVLDAPTAERSASGVVAYSAICPHTGCEVVNWLNETQILDCPCHNSEYDPKAGARVVSGPSPRGLAALPLRVADGKLIVARPFIGRLGIQQI